MQRRIKSNNNNYENNDNHNNIKNDDNANIGNHNINNDKNSHDNSNKNKDNGNYIITIKISMLFIYTDYYVSLHFLYKYFFLWIRHCFTENLPFPHKNIFLTNLHIHKTTK